jgi:hypothetical protein
MRTPEHLQVVAQDLVERAVEPPAPQSVALAPQHAARREASRSWDAPPARVTGVVERRGIESAATRLTDVAEGGRNVVRALQGADAHPRMVVRASATELLREAPRSALDLLGRRSLDHAPLR